MPAEDEFRKFSINSLYVRRRRERIDTKIKAERMQAIFNIARRGSHVTLARSYNVAGGEHPAGPPRAAPARGRFKLCEMIITNDKYHMNEINSSAYSVQMRLVVRNIQRSDLGGYKCISKNSIGDAEGNIRLYEVELPFRKNREEEDRSARPEESNDVRSSSQGSLREGEPRAEDAVYLGGRAAPARPVSAVLVLTAVYAAC